ncbi:MAG TPA: small acid-soluble spore protein SspJ [Bacillales bacterium]
MDLFKSKKEKQKEKSAKNMKGSEDALNEAEQALEGDPLQEAVKKNQKEQG